MPQIKVKSKQCRDCKRVLPISRFYVKEHRPTATRYFSRCKKCYYLWVYKRDKACGYKHHGLKQRHGPARYQLREAVKVGKVVKSKTCHQCGKQPLLARNLHGHHPDHSKPLEVVWLCGSCHRKEHRG